MSGGSRDRTDSLLDEIDQLVDDSLARGDQSGSFRGERYDKCSLCGDDYHFFAITKALQEMRAGSYGRDEFGIGIVDPDYRHQDDTSPIICPGSNYLGPPIGNREWGWYLRRTGSRPAPRFPRQSSHTPNPESRRNLRATHLPIRQWRFKGPFEPWVIEMRTDIEYAAHSPLDPLPRVVGEQHIATFTHQDPFRDIPGDPLRWFDENRDDIVENGFSHEGLEARMEPIAFQYVNMNLVVLPEDRYNEYPSYVEFRTDYPIWVHQWWLPFWELIGPTGQPVPLHQTHFPDGRTIYHPPGQNFEIFLQPLRVTMNMNDASIPEGFVPLGFTEGVTPRVHQDRPS